MTVVWRAVAVYLIIFVVFRLSGKRSVKDITTFDFVLLLIISEATQQALIGAEDYSLTAAVLAIVTLVGLDIGLTLLKQRWPWFAKFMEDLPIVLVQDGRPLKKRMEKERVDEEDVLASARELHGLERMDQIKYAVLERNGSISIVPK